MDNITAEQERKIKKHINEKVGNCPSCGCQEFTANGFVMAQEFNPEAMQPEPNQGKVYLAVMCNDCYRTLFFQAISMGLL